MVDTQDPDRISRSGGTKGAEGGAAAEGMLGRFRALPKQAQIAIVAVGVLGFLWMMGSRGGGQSSAQGAARPTLGVTTSTSQTVAFSGLESDRPVVMQNVYEQNRRDMSELRGRIEESFQQRDKALQDALSQNQELQRQMTQMMSDFTAEIKNLQLERAKDADRLAQLAEQQHQMEMGAPVDGSSGASPVQNKRQRIGQVTLGGASGVGGQALLSSLGAMSRAGEGSTGGDTNTGSGAHLPFIPPLGFVRATLLNGVDALVGGTATPALARIEGSYKTAMNSTVSLDGCFAMVEFQGNISTERAIGKPVRMTCVYPDGGAATYTLSGYVVDAKDGIIGVPGLLYEGDPTRIAASMMADFVAGIGELVVQNQNTTTVDSQGTQQTALTGDQTKAELASGASKAMSTISDYLKERVDRVQPFIRLDATREINMVITSGNELRAEGSPWTLLFDASAGDSSRARGVPGSVQEATGGAAPAAAPGARGGN